MRKRFMKGIVCMVLSLSMALGTVIVGASEKSVLSDTVTSDSTIITSSLKKEINVSAQTAGKISKDRTVKGVQAKTVVSKNAYLVYNAATYNKALNDIRNTTNWTIGEVSSDVNNTLTVNITLAKAGQLQIGYKDVSGNDNYTKLKVYQGNTEINMGNQSEGYYGVACSSKILPRGTYKLVVTQDTNGYAAVYPYYYTSENIGMKTNSQLIVGNGYSIAQTFKISGRRQVWIYSDKAGYGYIQRYTSGKWKTVSYQNYFYNSNGELERAYYALSTGTYRFVMKPANGNFVEFRYGSKAYSSSYATKQSKAKTLARKASAKYNVLTATDSKGRSHYYKIKVTKTRSTRINFTAYQNSGNIRVTVYGKGLKTKNLYLKGSKTGYVKGTLRKGTYYIRVTKMTQNTSGRYSVQYKY